MIFTWAVTGKDAIMDAAKGVKHNYVGEYADLIPDFLKNKGGPTAIDLDFTPNDTLSLESMLKKAEEPDHGHGNGDHGHKPQNPIVAGVKRLLLGLGALAGVQYGVYPLAKHLATLSKGLGTAAGTVGLVLQGLGIFAAVTGVMKIFDKGDSHGGGH